MWLLVVKCHAFAFTCMLNLLQPQPQFEDRYLTEADCRAAAVDVARRWRSERYSFKCVALVARK